MVRKTALFSLLVFNLAAAVSLEWMVPAQASPAAPVDALTGSGGWFGAGLLGMVLAWLLLKHLPEKDRQVKEMMERHEKLTSAMYQAAHEAAREQRDGHIRALDGLTEAARDEVRVIRTALTENTSAILDMRRVLEDLREDLSDRHKEREERK